MLFATVTKRRRRELMQAARTSSHCSWHTFRCGVPVPGVSLAALWDDGWTSQLTIGRPAFDGPWKSQSHHRDSIGAHRQNVAPIIAARGGAEFGVVSVQPCRWLPCQQHWQTASADATIHQKSDFCSRCSSRIL